jgi:hypothetical protein
MSSDPKILSQQIRQQKRKLLGVADLEGSFNELSRSMEREVQEVRALAAEASGVIPEVDFKDITKGRISAKLADLVKKRGCVVVRQVFSAGQVNDWNNQIVEYIEFNQYYDREIEKRGLDQYFGQLASGQPQIFGLYWSKPQIEARQSEELAATRRWLNRLWNHNPGDKFIFNPDHECSYADRLRRRQPGDSTLGLSPHADGGSVERWLNAGFQDVYRHVYSGEWQKYDPFDTSHRTETKEIPSPAVCQMFRTFQGWTALTSQGPYEGTLQLIPIARGMAWILLRALQKDVAEENLCGAKAGRALSVIPEYHQLLLTALVPIPRVQPGDTVWWHPDVIHAVEDHHQGNDYSTVMYIGAAPDCEKNRAFLPKQAEAFLKGHSCPDFAPENYEVDFVGRASMSNLTELGRSQMGLS